MISKEQLDAWDAEYEGQVVHIKSAALAYKSESEPAWECVFKCPARRDFKVFRGMIHNPARIAEANEFLAKACIISHTREQFDQLLDKFPAIADRCSPMIGNLAAEPAEAQEK